MSAFRKFDEIINEGYIEHKKSEELVTLLTEIANINVAMLEEFNSLCEKPCLDNRDEQKMDSLIRDIKHGIETYEDFKSYMEADDIDEVERTTDWEFKLARLGGFGVVDFDLD